MIKTDPDLASVNLAPKAETEKPSQFLIWGLFIFLALIWGTSFLLIKVGLEVFTSVQVGTMRIAVAFLTVLPFSLSVLAKAQRSLLFPFFLSGMMGNLLPSLLFSVAGGHLPSSISGCLNAFTPIFTMVMGIIIYKQKLSRWQLLGLSFGFAGAILIASTRGSISLDSINPYAGLVLLATVLYASNVNYIKYKLVAFPPIQNAIMALTLAGFPALLWLCFDQDFIGRLTTAGITHPSVLAIIALGVVGSAIGTLLFNRLIKMTTAIFTSSVTYAIPFVAVLLGLLTGEPFGLIQILGLALILWGVYSVNKK